MAVSDKILVNRSSAFLYLYGFFITQEVAMTTARVTAGGDRNIITLRYGSGTGPGEVDPEIRIAIRCSESCCPAEPRSNPSWLLPGKRERETFYEAEFITSGQNRKC